MRFSARLYAQHLGWTFKKHWQTQGKRIPSDTGAASELEKLGIIVKDVQEIVESKTERTPVEVVGNLPKVLPEDASHPHFHSQKCHMYGNDNILLEGMKQAQVLTKTLEVRSLPKSLEDSISKLQLPSTTDRNIQQIILASNVLDAEQVKLPKVKIPERPAYNLPREYGISHQRRSRLLLNRLLIECEKLAGRSVTYRRHLLDQVDFKVTLFKNEDLLQFNIRSDKMVTATKSIEPIKGVFDGDLPDMYPMKYTISLPKKNIYTTKTSFPVSNRIVRAHPHTIFTFFNKELAGNLHGSAVTPLQFRSRTLLNAFVVAATRAKQLYGESYQEAIPKPIVVQSINTDGRSFHFGVFQLNSLALGENERLKNYWFHEENVDLFTNCGYKSGRPYLEGYNKNVFHYLYAFYTNA